jgi:hypothetical protein
MSLRVAMVFGRKPSLRGYSGRAMAAHRERSLGTKENRRNEENHPHPRRPRDRRRHRRHRHPLCLRERLQRSELALGLPGRAALDRDRDHLGELEARLKWRGRPATANRSG